MTMYSYDEAYENSLLYFHGNDLAARVFLDKYAMRNKAGEYAEITPGNMHTRLAKEFARIDSEKYGLDYDERYDLYLDAMRDFARIVPQGSPMAAIGNKHQLMSASNCVVVESPEDSMEGIIDTGKNLAQLMKRRCGVGVDISTLRPDGMDVNNAARTTSGAWSFADFYSYITRMVAQNGRRGALMVTLSVHHPDVEKFTTMKHDLTKVTGANVSVRLSDEFLKAVEADGEYEQRWPVEGEPKVRKMVKARQVWDLIVSSATETAEPGLIMWDNMISNLPAHCYPEFKTISTNPCSEIALSAFDSCRLISINLTGYVRKAFEEGCSFDFKAFKSDVRLAMQMADNLVDLELELISKIQDVCTPGAEKELWQKLYNAGKQGRRTGLGTHGLADALAQLRIKYDSDESLEFIEKLYKTFRNEAYSTSVELAKVRGSFPLFDYELEKNCAYIKRLPKSIRDGMAEHGRRNISLLTQAPTGSVSMESRVGDFPRFNVSSGVEPVFRNFYTRRKKVNASDNNVRVDYVDQTGDSWQEFKVYHSNVENYLEKMQPEDGELPDYFVTSDQIDWAKRVELQGIEQQFLDHSISSTINLPKGTKPEVVGELYLKAWRHGLKGVTVYVDGSRDGVLITDTGPEVDGDGRPTNIVPSNSPKRPVELPADVLHATVKGVKWTILVGLLNGEPYEMFMGKADAFKIPNKVSQAKLVRIKSGNYNLLDQTNNVLVKDVIKTADSGEGAWTTRMMSMALRHGVPIKYLVDQLSKDGSVVDVNNVLARLLRKYLKAKEASTEKCPQCGSTNLKYEDGCSVCLDCGFSGCS